MSTKTAYLVRTEDGKCRTVLAQSARGAMRKFLDDYDADKGEMIDVKQRGAGEWERFKVQ